MAKNGQMNAALTAAALSGTQQRFQPIGDTDSELVFCHFM
jgi:Glutamine amidotransferases class-II